MWINEILQKSKTSTHLVSNVADVEDDGTTHHLQQQQQQQQQQQRGVVKVKLLEYYCIALSSSDLSLSLIHPSIHQPINQSTTYLFPSKVPLQDVWRQKTGHVHGRDVGMLRRLGRNWRWHRGSSSSSSSSGSSIYGCAGVVVVKVWVGGGVVDLEVVAQDTTQSPKTMTMCLSSWSRRE